MVVTMVVLGPVTVSLILGFLYMDALNREVPLYIAAIILMFHLMFFSNQIFNVIIVYYNTGLSNTFVCPYLLMHMLL